MKSPDVIGKSLQANEDKKGELSACRGGLYTAGVHAGAQILVTSITNAEIKVLVEEQFDQNPWFSHVLVDVSCS